LHKDSIWRSIPAHGVRQEKIVMCHIFAGQDPRNYAFETRSVRLSGHVTSVRLEARFWAVIEDIAAVQAMTVPQFLTALHDEAMNIHGDVPNFASLLRCCCLNFLEKDFDHAMLRREMRNAVAA
jgi:predicted DNA-binding ribbon-helix-helix protein